jgi:hypothetical protein
MATARRPAAAKTEPEATVTVHVTPGLVVFHDGQQRGGTLTGVPETVARDWAARGWVELVD